MGLFILACSQLASSAQYSNLKLNHYDERYGLANNNVNCLIQDYEGFIWMGTDNGLSRFDGYTFKNYFSDPSDSLSLVHNHIMTFYLSADSTLWIGTQYGVCSFNRFTDNFIRYNIGYTNGHIRGFYEENGTLFTINDKGEIFQILENSLSLIKNLNFHSYYYMRDKEGNHWFGGDEGVHCYTRRDEQLKLYQPDKKRDVAVFTLLEDGDTIWIGTRGDGIFLLNKKTGDVTPFHIKLNFIKAIQKDRAGNILIGDTENLIIYNKKENTIRRQKPLIEHGDKDFSAGAVDAIMQDAQGNLWLGIKFRGINLAFVDKGFRPIEYTSHDPFDETKKTIVAIAAENDQDIWMGSFTNGLEKVNLRTKTSQYFPCNDQSDGLQCGSIYELYIDTQDKLWIGNYNGGLQSYHQGSNTFQNRRSLKSADLEVPLQDIRSICEDHKGNYWILKHGSGIMRWNPHTGDIADFRFDPDDPGSLGNDWAFHAICDHQGAIWVATSYGLSVSHDGNSFRTYLADPGDSTSILSNEVFTLYEDSDHQLWVGTRQGLCRYIENTDNFIHITTHHGLIDNYICSIQEDDNRNLWIATKKGLSRLNTSTGRIENFDKGDGLQDNEFMINASAKTPVGYMVFGSVNCGTWFHPDSLLENTQLPEVYLTDLKLFNRTVPIQPDNEEAVLKKHIRYTQEIVLNHKQKVISFSFVAINYIHPEKNRYKYKLENFDEEWNTLEKNREITYTNLTPGEYTLRVVASNNDGHWNEEGVNLSIIVMPPFWKTLWFRLIIAMLFLIVTFSLYYLRIRNIREQNLKLEDTVRLRTKELQAKNEMLAEQTEELNASNNLLADRQEQIIKQTEELKEKNQQLFQTSDELREQKTKLELTNLQLQELNTMKDKLFSIIGHDLKGPINVVKGFAELMENEFDELDNERKKKYLGHINKSVNNTVSLLENLLSWSQTQSGQINYLPEEINIHLLIKHNISFFREHARRKEIKLEKSLDDTQILAYADQNMIDTVLRNLISNAIKFTENKGAILVGTENNPMSGLITVWVKDNGVGMSEKQVADIFRIDSSTSLPGTDGEGGTGLGLILCKEFVEKNGGTIWVESSEGKGSTFSFTIPASKK